MSARAFAIFILLICTCLCLPSANVRAQNDDDLDRMERSLNKKVKKRKLKSRMPAQTSMSANVERKRAKDPYVRYVFGVGYHSANSTTFKSASGTVGGNPASGEVVTTMQPAYELSLGLLLGRRRSFGMFGTVTYQTRREISRVDTTLNGEKIPVEYPGEKPSMQITIMELGGTYRFDNLYIPVGVNFPIAGSSTTPPEDPNGLNTRTNGGPGLGYQAGVGYFLWSGFHVEALYKVIAMQAKTTIPGTAVLDLKTGYTPGFSFQMRYGF